MAFWRTGDAIIAFSMHPSFNFDGAAGVRRQLRILRVQGIGETQYVGVIHQPNASYTKSAFRAKTAKKPFMDYYGKPAQKQWVCRHDAVVLLLRMMPYRCVRCWSEDRPRHLRADFLRSWHSLEDVLRPHPLLCDGCKGMSDVRNHRQTVRAAQEIVALQRNLKHLLRLTK